VFWVISVYFNIRNALPKFCPFLLGHSIYICVYTCICKPLSLSLSLYIYIYIFVCVCVYEYVYIYTRTSMCVCVYTHTHTHWYIVSIWTLITISESSWFLLCSHFFFEGTFSFLCGMQLRKVRVMADSCA